MEKPSTIDKAIEHLHLYNARFPRADIIEEALQQAKKDREDALKFIRHKSNCRSLLLPYKLRDICNCGYDKLIKQLSE